MAQIIHITGYSNASGEKVSYKFSFTTVPWGNFKEPNNFIQSSTVMTQGKTYKGLVESTGGYNNTRDKDWFSIKPASAGTYYVTLRNNNIDSYVYVEAYKNYETKRTIFGGKDYIDKNKTKGRTYYYKIRAYKYVNNYSCLGFFSRVESIKR